MLIKQFIIIAQVLGWINVILLTIFIFFNSFGPANNPDDSKISTSKLLKKRSFKSFEFNQPALTFGMTKNEVISKPGELMKKNRNSFYPDLAENEQEYIHFDKNQQAQIISLMYLSQNRKFSKFADIFKEKSPQTKQNNSGNFYFPGKGFSLACYCFGSGAVAIPNTMEKLTNNETFGH
ncbi:MAG TPA: hypothetical protein PKY82_15605 [Pyrinomonadaceae bacterium]|nr:hypothetical protein [Pyrinomonadaceae bacterium]